jgi:hypothetical protein
VVHFHTAGHVTASKGELNYVNYWPALTPDGSEVPDWVVGSHISFFSFERVLAFLRCDNLYPSPICNRVSIYRDV